MKYTLNPISINPIINNVITIAKLLSTVNKLTIIDNTKNPIPK